MSGFIRWALSPFLGGEIRRPEDLKPRSIVYTLHPREAETIKKIARDRGIALEKLGAAELAHFVHAFTDEVENPAEVARSETDQFRNAMAMELMRVRNEIVPSLKWRYDFSAEAGAESTDVTLTITWDPTVPPAIPGGLQTEYARREITDLATRLKIEMAIAQLMEDRGIAISGLAFFEDTPGEGISR